MIIFLGLGPFFIILTISCEGLFYFVIAIAPSSSVQLKHKTHQLSNNGSPRSIMSAADAVKQSKTAAAEGNYRSLTLSDVRVYLFFLFLLHAVFFSTGSIAPVSSFLLDAVYLLFSIFDPFSQATLLILRILTPCALVSINFEFLTKRLKLQRGSLFTVVICIGDYIALRFFWAVRDERSWLEIGESIIMCIIASALCVFVAGLEALPEVFVKGVELQSDM